MPTDMATPEPGRIDSLREELIAELRELKALRTEPVERAVRAVPRHLFVPEETIEQAYEAQRAPVIKKDEHGVTLSSVSAVRIQAFMLEQADIRRGMRVLEIGSGGYNAALIAELVGEAGEVTTIDIDPDVIDRARSLLSAAGYRHVHVIVADGEKGEPSRAPYDRIVVTVEAADLAPAWVDQLTEQGRIVMPLRMRGLTRHRQSKGRMGADLHRTQPRQARPGQLSGLSFIPPTHANSYLDGLLVVSFQEVVYFAVSTFTPAGTVSTSPRAALFVSVATPVPCPT